MRLTSRGRGFWIPAPPLIPVKAGIHPVPFALSLSKGESQTERSLRDQSGPQKTLPFSPPYVGESQDQTRKSQVQ